MPKTRAGSGQVKPNLQFQGTTGITIPVGTTAQRNPLPQAGEIRYNTDLNVFEGYTGTAWGSVGPYPFATVDYFTGDGTTSEFTLSNSITNPDNLIVSMNGVIMKAGQDFDLSYPDRIRFIELDGSTVNAPLDGAEIIVRSFQPITAASIPASSIGINELDVLDGTVGQFLRTDGAGNLSFATVTTDPAFGGSYIEGTVSNANIKENSISIRELAVSPGTIGQVLATDGSGNLAFISVAGGAGGSAGSFFDLSGTIALNQIPDNYIPQSKIDINGTAINGYVLSTDGTDFQWIALTANTNTSLSNLGSTAINASLLPATDSTIDLGSNTKKWRDLYLSGSTLYLGTAQITAAGSAINLPAGSTVGGSNIGAAVNNFSTISVAGQSSVVADSTTDTLTLVSGSGIAITTNASTDTITITNSSPNVSQNVFSTIAVAGQSNVVADSATDTLTLVAGSNITITTNAGTDTITINSAGGATSNSFATIAVAGQSNVVADSATDTLTLVAGSGMSITTDAGTDTVTIASTVTSGIALTALSVTVNSASGGGNLAYNNTTGVFSFTPPDFPSNLTDLSDVTISSPSNGQVLKYNSSTGKWVNAADLTGDGGTGISLGDLSVTTAAAAGSGALSYSNSTGIFTFTPSTASGVVNSGTASRLAFYSSTGTSVSETASTLSWNNSTGTLTVSNLSTTGTFTADEFTTTGVGAPTITSGSDITLDAASGAGEVIVTGDLSVSGDLTVSGAITGAVTSVGGTGTVNGLTLTGTVTSTGNLTLGGTLSGVNLASAVTGILPVANGGTGTSTPGLTAGTNVTISGSWPNQTINAASSSSSITWSISSSGSSDYVFSGPGIVEGNTNDPVLYLYKGFTYVFVNTTGGNHPFAIRVSNGGANYTSGVTGSQTGTQTFVVPMNAPATLYYQCTIHSSMGNVINIV
jgi:hypothetical protein